MRRGLFVALVLEVLLVASALLLLGGSLGATRWVAVGAGASLMGVVAVPSTLALLWARERGHKAFLTSVGAVFLGKMLWVAAALLVALQWARLPSLWFVLGLLLGWVLGFVGQALLLRRTQAPVAVVPEAEGERERGE